MATTKTKGVCKQMTKRKKVRPGVLEKNRKKMRKLYLKGWIIAKLPQVFHSRKKANAALENSRMLPKNKKKARLIKLQSVYTGKEIFIFIKKGKRVEVGGN